VTSLIASARPLLDRPAGADAGGDDAVKITSGDLGCHQCDWGVDDSATQPKAGQSSGIGATDASRMTCFFMNW
jgi:hypothetical protein